MFDLLSEIFFDAENECNINIAFNMANDGEQINEVHNMFINFANNPVQSKGLLIAQRLCRVTTGRSGLGLLFLILGRERENIKLVISRFPAERGILADKVETGLKLEFIEMVFMKNPNYYKAAYYKGKSIQFDLWSGFAIDKQVNYRNNEIAQYWIQHFLESNYKTTSKSASRRFALALREASISAKDISIKQELASLAKLISGLDRKTMSISKIIHRYSISTEAKDELYKNLPSSGFEEIMFEFDSEEFTKNAPYTCVELDNEGILIAPTQKFSQVFSREKISIDENEENQYRFSTSGRIMKEQLRGRK